MGSERELVKHYKELLDEIKTPLSSIKTHILYLKENICKEPEVAEEYLRIILRETDRLELLLKEVTESVKKVKLNLSLCDIDCIIKDVAKRLKSDFEEKGVTLKYNLKAKLPKLYVDEQKISQALVSLLSNALYAVPEGGRVEIIADSNEHCYLRIKDNGSGIQKSDMKSIFEPFYTTSPIGAGLGLYITKRIIDSHGGSINVSSEYGKGSEFLVILPTSHKESNEND